MKKVTRIITVKEVEYLSYKLAKGWMSFNEPIPDFSSRFPNILESCLSTPFQGFSNKSFYPTLISKTSMLFYLMIKNHPFQNGNKRIAMTTMFVFLHMNNKWLKVNTQELYNFAMWVTQSPPQVKNQTVKAIEVFLRSHLVDL